MSGLDQASSHIMRISLCEDGLQISEPREHVPRHCAREKQHLHVDGAVMN